MAEADLYNMSDVFISYSRRDSEFVHQLFEDIKATGKEVWADFEDIPKAADWWEEIKAGIDAADAFVFIITPDSVMSDICRQEIDHAVESNKRLLPILHREVTEEEHKDKIHSSISSHNWIFFREQDDYSESFKILLESLETDLDHNRTLTRLLVRAKEWLDNDKKSSYLLQGDDLKQADDWLSHSMDKNPAPTNLHAEYIKTSRTKETDRQRRLFIYTAVGMVISLFLAVFAVYQMLDARHARDAARDAQQEAEMAESEAVESEREARAIALAARASEALANNNPDLALVLAGEAYQIDPHVSSIATSLADAAYAPGTIERIELTDVPTTAVYAPDSSLFATGFSSGAICLYDGTTYLQMTCLTGGNEQAHADETLWIHMNDDGTRLLSSGSDNRLVLWNIDSGSADFGMIVSEVTVENLSASSLASDGSFAVFGTTNGRFGYWDLSDNAPDYLSYHHGDEINVIALNADNNRALAGTGNGVMLEYNINNLELINNYRNINNLAPISSVAYNPDSSIAVSGDENATLTSWNVDSRTIIRTYQGHDENVTAIAFSENGRTMFTASWDNSIREWDVASGRVVQSFYGHTGGINALSLTADNFYMVSGGFDSSLRVWLVHPTIFDSQFLSSDENLYAADWNDEYMVAANSSSEIFIYDRNNGQLTHEVPLEPQFDEHGQIVGINFVTIRDNGANFALVRENCEVTLFSRDGMELWVNQLPEDSECHQLGFRPGVDELLVLSSNTLYQLDGRTGDMIGTVPYAGGVTDFRSFAFTPDGNQLVIGMNSRTDNLRLIDFVSGEIIRDFNGHSDGVLAIDISDDGRQMASGSFDNDARVWDLASGDLVWLLEGHSDRLQDVDFDPQGASLVTSSNDTTMRLWDLSTGETRYTYRGHTERVVVAMFSEDGERTRILTASHDGTLIIWKFPQQVGEMREWIEDHRYIRELSCGERNNYLGENNECD